MALCYCQKTFCRACFARLLPDRVREMVTSKAFRCLTEPQDVDKLWSEERSNIRGSRSLTYAYRGLQDAEKASGQPRRILLSMRIMLQAFDDVLDPVQAGSFLTFDVSPLLCKHERITFMLTQHGRLSLSVTFGSDMILPPT